MAQQKLLLQHREVEYFYAYVAESEYSNVGYWIVLQPDKSLSLEDLRGYFSTCFGIKYKQVDSKNKIENKYIRYHNGYFRFPTGLDMNNTRFVAYYYNDVDDVNAFMALAEANDCGAEMVPTLEFRAEQAPQADKNNSTFLHRTLSNFDVETVLQRGAQSTPKPASVKLAPLVENVSSTSDVILNEKTIEVISVHDSQSIVPEETLPPPPPGPPQRATTSFANVIKKEIASPQPVVSGIKAKLGPIVTSTSDLEYQGKRAKREPINTDNCNAHESKKKPVIVKVETTTTGKNIMNRYQANRAQKPVNLKGKTPLKITLNREGRYTQRENKILKIEDEKGRTTALLTKRKWAGKPTVSCAPKRRRYETDDDCKVEVVNKPSNIISNPQQFYHRVESPVYEDYYRTLNILLVGFGSNPPVIHETTTYFNDFGVVTNFQLYNLDNRGNTREFYAFMKIRTDDAISLFADRHLYNGAVIYAIRVDDTRLASRVNCKICDYQGLNVAYLNYHMEGQFHQLQLRKRLESLACSADNVYRDSYYRITYDELYVQYPNGAVQEIVRNDYWKRVRSPTRSYGTAVFGPPNQRYTIERGRDY